MKDNLNKMKDDIYTIEVDTYDKYVELNGARQADCPQALEIKDNNAKYYVIYNKGEFFDDFCIYKEDNWIALEIRKFFNNDLMKVIFNFIKSDYEYVSLYVPVENIELFDYIKESYNVIKVLEIKCGTYKYHQVFIDLNNI